MKKILILISLLFLLISCWENKELNNDEVIINNDNKTNVIENKTEDNSNLINENINEEKPEKLTIINNELNNDNNNSEIIKDYWSWLIYKKDKNNLFLYFNKENVFKDKRNISFDINTNNIHKDLLVLTKYDNADEKELGFPTGSIIFNKLNKNYYFLNYHYWYKSKFLLWENGIYFIVWWQNWYSDLRMITNKWKDISLFKWKEDNWKETIEVYDYELLLNKKIKVFYTKWLIKEKKEKIINLEEDL